MSAYANAGATPFPTTSLSHSTATPPQQYVADEPSLHSAKADKTVELDAAGPSPNAFSLRFVACSAPDVDTGTPVLRRQSGNPISAAKLDGMLLGSPYQATDSEISFDVMASPHTSDQQLDQHAERVSMDLDDRWQMEASSSSSPISYVSGPVANRLGSKVHASPSYDPRCASDISTAP